MLMVLGIRLDVLKWKVVFGFCRILMVFCRIGFFVFVGLRLLLVEVMLLRLMWLFVYLGFDRYVSIFCVVLELLNVLMILLVLVIVELFVDLLGSMNVYMLLFLVIFVFLGKKFERNDVWWVSVYLLLVSLGVMLLKVVELIEWMLLNLVLMLVGFSRILLIELNVCLICGLVNLMLFVIYWLYMLGLV